MARLTNGELHINSQSRAAILTARFLCAEFKFHVAAIHHAHEVRSQLPVMSDFSERADPVNVLLQAYLVPDLLKKYYGGAPAVAQFAVTARYKWESMRGSEFATTILADAGSECRAVFASRTMQLLMCTPSQSPTSSRATTLSLIRACLSSCRVLWPSSEPLCFILRRYLMWEAAQAHHYGLNWTLAMDAVFSAPAKAAGLEHRIGYAVEGHDADLVVWDSMPLSLGATPAQVFIDGVKQLKNPHVVAKPKQQGVPRSRRDAAERAKETRETGGKLSYAPKRKIQDVVFVNVRSTFGISQDGEVEQTFGASYDSGSVDAAAKLGLVVVRGSEIVCTGACDSFASGIVDVVDLAGGSLMPGLVGYGPALGVSEIAPEKSTVDGNTFDIVAPAAGVPEILQGTIIKGSEALSLGGKELQYVQYWSALQHFGDTDLVAKPPGSFTTLVS